MYRGEAVAIKYRIKYENYAKYPKNSVIQKLILYLSPVLCSVAVILAFILLRPASNLYELFLPGDPAVTIQAFNQLSGAIGRGDALPQALEAFCQTVINAQ